MSKILGDAWFGKYNIGYDITNWSDEAKEELIPLFEDGYAEYALKFKSDPEEDFTLSLALTDGISVPVARMAEFEQAARERGLAIVPADLTDDEGMTRNGVIYEAATIFFRNHPNPTEEELNLLAGDILGTLAISA